LDVSCIVLAGGKGLRLGRDKALETINNRHLLLWVLSRLSFLKSDIIIVIAEAQSPPELDGYPGLRVVTDIYPDKGPLGGICTGLLSSNSTGNLVIACDMPFLNQDLLLHMIGLSADADLVVPRWDGLVEPLHAVYTKSCLEPVQNMIGEGVLSVTKLFSRVRVRYVEAGEIDRFDPKHLSFFNVNTEADLKIARQLAGEI